MEIKHTLTFTTIKTAVVVVAALLLVFESECVRSSGGLGSIVSSQELVNQLGRHGNRNVGDVKKLSRTPYSSVGLLIAQLRTIDHPDRVITGYGNAQFNHLVWVIAALRFITGGMDFCAPTKWNFESAREEANRGYWLHLAKKSCVTFFAVWPSRNRYYIAPLDAQQEIIDAWHRWYAEKGKKFAYRPLANPEPWQWLEGVEKPVAIGNMQ